MAANQILPKKECLNCTSCKSSPLGDISSRKAYIAFRREFRRFAWGYYLDGVDSINYVFTYKQITETKYCRPFKKYIQHD